VHDFRANGYLPEALLNFLALLGWNPGGDREHMSIAELIELFSMEGIGKSNAKFNREKLLAFNTEACAKATPERLVRAMREYLAANPDSPLNTAGDTNLARVIKMKAGFRTLREVDETSRFLFMPDDSIIYDPDAAEKVLRKNSNQGLMALQAVLVILRNVPDWTHASIETAINEYCQQQNLGLGKVAQPLRVALSGNTISPPIFDSLVFLGKEKTLKRIERCMALITPS
jgi:glutamyl/glutaminyl-tRNA synthetase